MSHERTIEQLTSEIEHLTGTRVRIGRVPFYGIYLDSGGDAPRVASSDPRVGSSDPWVGSGDPWVGS